MKGRGWKLLGCGSRQRASGLSENAACRSMSAREQTVVGSGIGKATGVVGRRAWRCRPPERAEKEAVRTIGAGGWFVVDALARRLMGKPALLGGQIPKP